MTNANNQSTLPTIYGVEYQSGVGTVTGSTIPRFGGATETADKTKAATSTGQVYNGVGSGYSFLNEPFAVWLGMILLLMALKFLSESPKTSINPAKIEIGGYNWLAVGVSAATFITIFKVIFNRWQVPGLTEYANAL